MMSPELAMPEALPYDLELDQEADSPEQAVFLALGAASACWDNLRGAGVFESTRAKQIGDQLMAYLYDHGLPRG